MKKDVFAVVLEDGETWTLLPGCQLVAIKCPLDVVDGLDADDWPDEEVEWFDLEKLVDDYCDLVAKHCGEKQVDDMIGD